MKQVVIFSKNAFHEVEAPDGMEGEEMVYGTLLLHLIHDKAYTKKKAEAIAEAVVYKRLYPGLEYGKEFEREIEEALAEAL